MRVDTLLSPGVLSNSQTLRHATAKAISNVEIATQLGGNGSEAVKLSAFLTHAAAQLATIVTASVATTAQSTAAVLPTTGTAGVTATVFTFTARNAAGVALKGQPVTVVRTGTATGGTLSALTGYTDASGVFTVNVTATDTDGAGALTALSAGTVILTATIDYPGAIVDAVKAATYTAS